MNNCCVHSLVIFFFLGGGGGGVPFRQREINIHLHLKGQDKFVLERCIVGKL